MWVSGHNLSSVETTPEQRSPRSAFPPCWEPGIIGGRKSKPPSGKKRQPTGLHKSCFLPLFSPFLQEVQARKKGMWVAGSSYSKLTLPFHLSILHHAPVPSAFTMSQEQKENNFYWHLVWTRHQIRHIFLSSPISLHNNHKDGHVFLF